ncbi:hypothetical protein DFO77_12465 [Marinilabilia salmonicolor]|uniref:HEPN domain-containing protein n=1 Tax=Marinilabilia salmonicolor TaxID=989 RepID=A0A368UMX5_9BACT|nr:hypothetical protein DFO77_12465 [Marinilabilia salmonicolor]
MSNKTYAGEWLTLAERNLKTARLLIRENHFTDIITIYDYVRNFKDRG